MNKRKPAVSGTFYPNSREEIINFIEKNIDDNKNKINARGMISPHAGYIYSGACALKGFSRVIIPDTVIILGVNHRGLGKGFSVDSSDLWITPLGDIPIDKELSELIVKNSELFEYDNLASMYEHSIEVQLPLIRYFNENIKIVPITIGIYDLDLLIRAGKEISKLIGKRDDVMIIASSDMSHYVSEDYAKKVDFLAIREMENINPEAMFNTVVKNNISMCGLATVTMMLSSLREMGVKNSEIVEYTNSGVITGDKKEVVAYLSMIFY